MAVRLRPHPQLFTFIFFYTMMTLVKLVGAALGIWAVFIAFVVLIWRWALSNIIIDFTDNDDMNDKSTDKNETKN
jgi:hypothetical protein